MKLASFDTGSAPRIGVVVGDEIADLSAVAPDAPGELAAWLENDAPSFTRIRGLIPRAPRLAVASVRLLAPVGRPPKILCVGLNYADHIRETGAARPPVPVIFNKQSTAVTGPGAPVYIPPESAMVDYEGELALVIGRRCRRVPRERVLEVVAGYTICNDVSVRDWQKRTPTMTMGKSWDSHCPLGPWIVTADEIADPQALELTTYVNGERRQHASTRDMIFSCVELVEHISTACTLEPGDVISTGTPSGVGVAMTPPRWLRAGDVVRIEIEGIGELLSPVENEPDAAGRSGA